MVSLTDIMQAIDQLDSEERAKLRAYIDQQPNESAKTSFRRVAGLHEHLGHAWVSEDFDDPLPESFWLGRTLN